MATIVCQNLVSCFESQLTEITTTTLKLKVVAPTSPPPAATAAAFEFGNWGCLQTTPKESSLDKILYTHPLAKKSSFSRLSSKSLELCTENLGSETGTDIIACSGAAAATFSASPPSAFYSTNSVENPPEHKRADLEEWKRVPKSPSNYCIHHEEGDGSRRKIRNFPPPLTTISGGSGSLQVRRRREGGRLIIDAVEAPARSSCFRAERSGGRLRLCFTEAAAASGGGEEAENGDERGEETAAEEEIESENEEIEGEMNMEIGIEKIQRLSRCHGNRGMCSDFNPALWVATS